MSEDKKYILIMEDDQAYGRVFERKLNREGFEAVWAKDGKEGLEKLDERQPDLLIVDLMMPEVDGFGVLEGIRERGIENDFGIIVATNLSQDIDMDKARELGADDYFIKSNLSVNEMVEKVKENLS